MIITSIILSGLALALSVWMGRKNPVRSSGLTAGMLVLLMLAPILLWLPKVHMEVSVPWAAPEVVHIIEADSASNASSVLSLMSVLLWVYGFVCVVLCVRLAAHHMVIKRWCDDAVLDLDKDHLVLLEHCGERLNLTKLPILSYSDKVCSPVITGLLKPKLLLPSTASEWSHETLEMVMLHELGHVQRRDLWTSLAGQIACALHWFNPLVWMLRKRLTHECEYACDAHVISCGANTRNYINALCDVAESCHEGPMLNSRRGHSLAFSAALSMASDASLRNRVENLLEKKKGVSRSSSLIVMTILTVSAGAALAINLVRPDVRAVSSDETVDIPSQEEVDLRLSANPFPGE